MQDGTSKKEVIADNLYKPTRTYRKLVESLDALY